MPWSSLLHLLLPGGGLASRFASVFFGFFTQWLAHGAVWMTSNMIGQAIAKSTAPVVNGPWFLSVMGDMLPVEELVVAPILFAATIGAVLRQDMRRLARAWLACLPLSLLGGFVVVYFTGLGLRVTDGLSQAVQAAVSPDLAKLYAAIVPQPLLGLVASGPVAGLLAVVFMAGALVIWVELALRSAAVELAVLFMPLALAGLIWPATAHWAKRLIEVLAALLLAKPVIVGALCLGAHSLTASQGTLSALVTGTAILLLATFAPLAVLKLAPVVEASALAHLHGLSREPFRLAERAVQMTLSKASDLKGPAAAGPSHDGESLLPGALLARVSSDDHPLGPARPVPPGASSSASRDG